ncbi:hypothetical protein HMSP1_5 [Sinorhizobium phage HMSP1-Susan]|nr:hypothetical protein HMSP1_5 [Sinorhizobium phage HMSP1-Susan]
MNYRVSFECVRLSDTSEVFNVILSDKEAGKFISIPAVSELAALRMGQKIMDAINEHSNSECYSVG